MCKYFSRYRQKRNRPVATALRLWSFALVERDDNAFFPFSWNSSRGPHIGDDLMQSFTDWLFGTFPKFCSYAICTCLSRLRITKFVITETLMHTGRFLVVQIFNCLYGPSEFSLRGKFIPNITIFDTFETHIKATMVKVGECRNLGLPPKRQIL